jgi:hypothetical protein
MREVIAEESDSPATQGGRGLTVRGDCASSCQSSSPAARGGRGRLVASRIPILLFVLLVMNPDRRGSAAESLKQWLWPNHFGQWTANRSVIGATRWFV